MSIVSHEIAGHQDGIYRPQLDIPDIPADADNLTAALKLAAAGLYILPGRNGTKHPGSVVGVGWQHKSSRDPKVIAAWFAGITHILLIHCGRSGLVVFDIDDPDRVPDLLAAHLWDAANPVPYQSTRPNQHRRGHYLFGTPQGRTIGNSTGRLAAGWGEVRGLNGVIVSAPSRHPDGGHYRWEVTGAVPVLPDDLGEQLNDAIPAVEAAADAGNGPASRSSAVVEAFIAEHTKATRPGLIHGWVSALRTQIAAGESRNFTTTKVVTGACKEARAGFLAAGTALETLKAIFIAAVAKPPISSKQAAPRFGDVAQSEWNGIVAWAVRQANAADIAQVRARTNQKMPAAPAWRTNRCGLWTAPHF